MSNPGTRICFRVGDDDARKLAQGFSSFEARDIQNLETGRAICRVERSDWDFNLAVPFPQEPSETEAIKRREEVIAASRKKYANAEGGGRGGIKPTMGFRKAFGETGFETHGGARRTCATETSAGTCAGRGRSCGSPGAPEGGSLGNRAGRCFGKKSAGAARRPWPRRRSAPSDSAAHKKSRRRAWLPQRHREADS